MRVSLSYITTTSAVARQRVGVGAEAGFGPHSLDPLGYDPASGSIYLLEHYEDETGDLPQLYVMHTEGTHVGRLAPVRSWSQGPLVEVESQFEYRLRTLRERLVELPALAIDQLSLRTRVTRRRALRLYQDQPPVRKYELRVTVRPADASSPIASIGASELVTAYLRPRAYIADAVRVPGAALALALVEYIGLPFELGYAKQVALLVPLT
jgi:hypothetical protein